MGLNVKFQIGLGIMLKLLLIVVGLTVIPGVGNYRSIRPVIHIKQLSTVCQGSCQFNNIFRPYTTFISPGMTS